MARRRQVGVAPGESYRELAADGSLSQQGRFDKAQRYLESLAPKIQRGYEKAARLLQEEAQRKTLSSVPLPGNHTLTTKVKNSSDLLAIQNEAQSIIAKIERRQAKMPTSPPPKPLMMSAFAVPVILLGPSVPVKVAAKAAPPSGPKASPT
jgi:hypothetical protein